ncbi:hypothetical protein BJ508DRAFT_217920 [Ascobolus immersus RN42]|uniref:Uncharacterized protein n=1 Tax=Ascobolus immersus RN42 TaxID=1160509 RepID=A0A3N4HAN0_ASCIM|nr:hypothetical protein BJ508DRAFT_217920 [Ascobolus immersus RN42]
MQRVQDGRPCYNWEKSYREANSTIRTDEQFREYADFIEANKYLPNGEKNVDTEKFAEQTGISGKSVFSRLGSIFFPESFPPCTMHLYYENVARAMFEHLAGRFFISRPGAVDEDSESDEETEEELGKGDKKQRKRKRKKKKKKRNAPRFIRRQGANAPFFANDDPYNVKPKHWTQMGRDTAASNSTYPDQLGEEMLNLETTFRKMKAANWQRFVFHQSPVYFKKYLPKEHYDEWMNMVEAMRLSTRKVLDELEIEEVRPRCPFICPDL